MNPKCFRLFCMNTHLTNFVELVIIVVLKVKIPISVFNIVYVPTYIGSY